MKRHAVNCQTFVLIRRMLIVMLAITAPTLAVGDIYRVCISADTGVYMTSGGTWTRDGLPIGTSFTGGAIVVAPGKQCDETRLAVTPNDYHANDVHTNVLGGMTALSLWKRWSLHFEGELEFPLVAGNGPDDIDLILDVQLQPSGLFGDIIIDKKLVFSGMLADAPLKKLGLAEVGSCTIGRCPIVDFNCDGSVDFADLTQLLAAWGPCGQCIEDLDGDGMVGFSDLSILLSSWTA